MHLITLSARYQHPCCGIAMDSFHVRRVDAPVMELNSPSFISSIFCLT